MLIKETKYCYNDIAIVPAIQSNIEHRSECNPYIGKFEESPLPIFTAPMSTVVNEQNFKLFEDNNITPILPRNIDYKTRLKYLKMGKWVAVSLSEFETLFVADDWDFSSYPEVNVLIDIANGHMSRLSNLIEDAKKNLIGAIILKLCVVILRILKHTPSLPMQCRLHKTICRVGRCVP